jgi:sirohydrochlorin cobaltochelatase
MTEQQQEIYPHIEMSCLSEMGIGKELLQLVREREIETHLGQVNMNCEMCKFRLAALDKSSSHDHHHHDHSHDHHHHHHQAIDPYAKLEDYHDRIWQVP